MNFPDSTPPASGDHAVTVSPSASAIRQQLPLDVSLEQAVGHLEGCERRPSAPLGEGVGPCHHPRGCVGDPDVEHFAGPDDVVEGSPERASMQGHDER
jgi:hypothetical protein